MSDQNDETIKTYNENFQKYVERTPQEFIGDEFKDWMNAFASRLPTQGRIFELGSAGGRDARYFKAKGFNVFCTDVIHEALESLSKKGFETASFDFRDEPNQEWLGEFDGVFANAVLLHAPGEIFVRSLGSISKILREKGILAFSVKAGEGEEVTLQKMDAPRYFKYWTKEELEQTMSRVGFEILEIRTAENGKWLQVIAKK